MPSHYLSDELRLLVRERANGRCEYCQTSEWLTGIECEIDHIVPRSAGGQTTAANLCLACTSCNGYKWAKTHAAVPQTGESVPLFHPRQQLWKEHFSWNENGTEITGLTPCGRATIEALQMNHMLIVAARSLWVKFGQHPPD